MVTPINSRRNYILHASKITPSTMSLRNVIVFKFRGKENFASRIDAELANLGNKQWHLENVRITAPEKPLTTLPKLSIPTNLTQENIQDSFAKPETMSFWALPGFIAVLEKAGFSGLRHRLYWHSQTCGPHPIMCDDIVRRRVHDAAHAPRRRYRHSHPRCRHGRSDLFYDSTSHMRSASHRDYRYSSPRGARPLWGVC